MLNIQKNTENITYTYPCYRYLWNPHPFIFSRDNHCGIFLVHGYIILLCTSDFINVCRLLIAFCVLKYIACIFTQYYISEIYPFSVLPQYCLHPETLTVVCPAASDSSLWVLRWLSKFSIPPILIYNITFFDGFFWLLFSRG